MKNYSVLSKILHKAYLKNYFISRASLELEFDLHQKKLLQKEIEKVVFISGLARSGTTILLRKVFSSNEFASLQYNNMPFLFLPNLWSPKTKIKSYERAHGDNIKKLGFIKNFKNHIGTTQSKPFDKLQNFGGFTDGDRGVFLANHFQAKKIVLLGMDFGGRIGKFSETKKSDRKIKLMKLAKGESLLEWLSTFSKSELFTTSKSIKGFKKISYRDLDIIIT